MNSVIDFSGIPSRRGTTQKRRQAPVLLMLFCLIFSVAHSAVGAPPDANQQGQPSLDHGPVDLLRQEIVQSREAADFLQIAQRHLKVGNREAAFDALLALFETNDSDFINVEQQNGNANVYEAGVSVLIESGFPSRVAWSKRLEPLARALLRDARFDDHQLRKVARKYPLTESGLTAHLLLIRNMVSRQQIFTATASIRRLEERYSGVTTDFAARPLIKSAQKQIDRARGRSVALDSIPGGHATSNHEAAISLWQPIWEWRENVWDTPQITSAFSGLLQPASRTDLTSNSWQPTVSGEHLFKRTPTRIACFDLQTGKQLWWVPTDTFDQGVPGNFSRSDSLAVPPRTTINALRMKGMGTISVSTDFIFFVDHYRGFQVGNPDKNDFSRAFNRLPSPLLSEESNGERLVAVSRTDPPTIAWTVGSPEPFNYEVKRSSTNRSSESSSRSIIDSEPKETTANDDGSKPEMPFRGHQFLGPPVAFEQCLYVLTSDHEMIWLNCLVEGTGRLLYRRMIADIDFPSLDSNLRLQSKTDSPGASLVGIHDGTLLCLLSRGLVIGASINDGRIQWATSLSSLQSQQQLPSARYLANVRSRPGFSPLLDNGRLIWCAENSNEISCIDCRTGVIKWQIPGTADSPGQAAGSNDLLPAGIANGQLILSGERHVRSIRVEDGTVNWTTGINGPNGNAVVVGETCWIPTLSGMVVPVDIVSGRKGWPVKFTQAITGSLFHAGKHIIAATPISLEAYPLLEHEPRSDDRNQQESPQAQVASLLSSNRNTEQSLHKLLSDPAKVAELSFHEQRLVADRILSTDVPQNTVASLMATIPENVLTNEQARRRQILEGGRGSVSRSEELVRLDPDWWVRTDVAAAAFDKSFAIEDLDFDMNQIVREPATLQPELLKQHGLTLADIADRLAQNRPEAAELLMLKQASEESNQQRRQRLFQRLRKLRIGSTAKQEIPLREYDERLEGKLEFHVEELFHLTLVRPMNQFPQLTREPIIIQTHSLDSGQRLFLQDRKLFAVDLHRGSVAKSLKLEGSVDQLIYTATPPGQLTPALLPLVDQTHVGAVSLINPAVPRLLWRNRWERAPFDNSPLRSGPVTSSGMIFATNHRIGCLHPLTGNLLWRRDFSTAGTQTSFLPETRFAADDSHLVVLSHGHQSGTVFAMANGKLLGTLKYDVPTGLTPVVSGCNLLYPVNGKLKLTDLTSGRDLLKDSNLEILPSSSTRLIDRNRVVILTANHEVAVLNLRTAKLEAAVEIPAELLPRNAAGFQAFEQHGRLFVCLRRWDGRNRQLSATSAVGDRRMTSGTLVSIDLESGQYWAAQNPTSVLMEIAGDPSPLLLLWSRQTPTANRQFRFNRQTTPTIGELDTLLLRILDQRTGQELLRTDRLSWANPLRCVHDSESRMITIETDASEIKLRYTAAESDSK